METPKTYGNLIIDILVDFPEKINPKHQDILKALVPKSEPDLVDSTGKPQRASPSYKIADCELSNSYLLTRKIFSSNRFSYNLVKRVGLYNFKNCIRKNS